MFRRAFFTAAAVFLLAESLALMWIGPYYLMRTIRRVLGGAVAVSGVRLAFPFTTALLGVRSLNNTQASGMTIPRVVIAPRWLSVPKRTLWVDTVEIERPIIRVTRPRVGKAQWPAMPQVMQGADTAGRVAMPNQRWFLKTVHIDSLRIVDGVFEFIDERHERTFHIVVDHVSFNLGPLTIPVEGLQTSFALQAVLAGNEGEAAPIYCSGWFDSQRQDLQAACQHEPLPLSIFAPYFERKPLVRPYGVTMQSSSHWLARANQLDAKIQVELTNLAEGDLSIHGRTIVDVRRMTRGREPRLRGEFDVSGALDRPSQWRMDFRAGDEPVQALVERLEEHQITVLSVPFFGRRMNVHLAAGGPEVGLGMEETGKEIREALELLAEPIPEPAPPAIEPLVPPATEVAPETPAPELEIAPATPTAEGTPEPASLPALEAPAPLPVN